MLVQQYLVKMNRLLGGVYKKKKECYCIDKDTEYNDFNERGENEKARILTGGAFGSHAGTMFD